MYFITFRDHAGGNKELCSSKPGLTFCGNDKRIDAQNKQVSNGQQFNVSTKAFP